MEKEIVQVSFFYKNSLEKISSHEVNKGDNLLDVLQKHNIPITVSCSGNGTCGKCGVYINNSNEPVLSCKTICSENINVYIDKNEEMKILSDAQNVSFDFSPLVKKVDVEIEKPTLENSFDIEKSIRMALDNENIIIPIDILSNCISIIRESNNKISVTYNILENKIIDIKKINNEPIYAFVFDLGTTTTVGKLYNLLDGAEISHASTLNKQDIFGHDVMSRISYSCKDDESIAKLKQAAIMTINEIIEKSLEKVLPLNIKNDDIHLFAITGNTTMLHLFLGVDATTLSEMPFVPVFSDPKIFKADKINVNKNALCYTMPIIGGFVGGDTVSCILASNMINCKKINIIVDIGTNGEIAIGNNNFILSSSAPAGPAFEGAEIEFGMRGTNGAIEYVSYDEKTKDINIKTIGNITPIGICGSGLIDIISSILDIGVVSETGQLYSLDDAPSNLSDKIKNRLKTVDGINRFILTDKIYLTQKDIREFQLAKAAILSIIRLLMESANVDYKDIDKIYIAGAFGNYIRIESALNIELIPKEFEGKIESIGNAALTGTMMGALSKVSYNDIIKIKSIAKNMEYGGSSKFQTVFAESLFFNSSNIDL